MSHGRKRPKSSTIRIEGNASRREFMKGSVGSALALGLGSGLSPAGRALAQGPPSPELQVLDEEEAAVYGAWCDVLAPGAAEAGVARYLDKQLAAPHPDSLLLLRVLGNPPFDELYRGGISGIDEESQTRFGQRFVSLGTAEQRVIVEAAAAGSTLSWQEPDPSFFYFISRADAVDVVWGTESGFRKLSVPYLAHIRPPEPW